MSDVKVKSGKRKMNSPKKIEKEKSSYRRDVSKFYREVKDTIEKAEKKIGIYNNVVEDQKSVEEIREYAKGIKLTIENNLKELKSLLPIIEDHLLRVKNDTVTNDDKFAFIDIITQGYSIIQIIIGTDLDWATFCNSIIDIVEKKEKKEE
jgi:hypothetical protein